MTVARSTRPAAAPVKQDMHRRRFVQLAAAGTAALAAPRLALGANVRVLRFVPHADLTILDPTWTTAYVTRNHGYLVFNTLFGQDSNFQAQPQMVEGVRTENDRIPYVRTLRDGLKFHDGEPVRGRDCVASLKRWAQRDELGKALFAATDELSSPDDRTIAFRLNRPFPLLPSALGKKALMMAAIMPERIAAGDPGKPITEMVGSGPYRYVPGERISGDRVVYARNADYVPRRSGTPEGTCVPRSRISTGSNGRSSPMPRQPRRRCRRARSTGGSCPARTFSPACAPSRG